MAKIIISKLRHINSLEFDIPGAGVWLLTGTNGTGKSSVLGCLRRIGYKNAFPVHFPASRKSDRLDSNEGASICYKTSNGEVTYTYATERWAPTPKSASKILEGLGYPETIYVAADADRIEPRKEDFSPNKVRPAQQDIIEAANKIFGTQKFHALKTINVRTGIGSQAFVVELPVHGKQAKSYYSEKNLSLGELCILKLLRKLSSCKRGALILIDEIELALHPTAQAELLEYLKEIAMEKSLTVVVSTHSATLIKQADRGSILYLQSDEQGNVICAKNCFSSYVLGALAYQEESASDVLIYVEDEAARTILEQFVRKFLTSAISQQHLIPSVTVIAVGGFVEVLRFYIRQRAMLPSITRAYVMLDADAEYELENATKLDLISIYRDERQRISFLPFTPEEEAAKYIFMNRVALEAQIRLHFGLNGVHLRTRDVRQPPQQGTPGSRNTCKDIVNEVCNALMVQIPNATFMNVKEVVLKIFAENYFVANRQAVMQLLGSIIRG
ncbi:AAA family ATPase [Pseudomonas idahonensis]|uniref:ATP-dependent nuclease n=1 Tax=Pseudomonas idahonensis TaxID=2942628 RepID=UPI0030D3A534